MTDRRRNTLILLIVAGLIAASVAVIASKKTRLGLDLKGGVQLVYQAKPTAQAKVDAESLNRAIDIMRKRVDQLGVAQPEIQRSGADEINVALPDVKDAGRAEQEVGKTAQLFFYDWEPNVIGPDGKPAAAGEQTVTGGAERRRRAVRPDRVPGLAACDQTRARTAQERHDLEQGLHAGADRRLHLRRLVSDRTRARKGARRTGRNRKEPVRRGEVQEGPERQGRARQPRHGAGPRAPSGKRKNRQGHEQKPQQLLRAQGRLGADRRRRQEPDAELRRRRRRHGRAERHVRLHRPRQERRSRTSPRKSPTAARKRSCRASARKRRSSTSRWCSTTS